MFFVYIFNSFEEKFAFYGTTKCVVNFALYKKLLARYVFIRRLID